MSSYDDNVVQSIQSWIDGEHSFPARTEGDPNTLSIMLPMIDPERLVKGVLPISVDRFSQSCKNQNPIQEPFNITLRRKHQRNGTQDNPYTLAAFIEHIGHSSASGHYVAYVKQGAQWGCYNDASVSVVNPQAVKAAAEQATLYFYQPR